MNKETIINFATSKKLTPVAWFGIKYPAFAIKVRYHYPSSDPSDFQDRALLRLIDAGIPYNTACAILLIDDPHESILRRFSSSDPGPQLVNFDKELNRRALPPMGRARIERPVLNKRAVASCFIDGVSCEPFPKDVIEHLESNRFHPEEIGFIANGDYPFEPTVESRLEELNTRLNDKKDKKLLLRLQLPSNAAEMSISLIDPEWIRDLSIGVFLKDEEIQRYLFCSDSESAITPFGYVQNLDLFKLTVNEKKFGYRKDSQNSPSLFAAKTSTLTEMLLAGIEHRYGKGVVSQSDISINPQTTVPEVYIENLDGAKSSRLKLLSSISEGYMSIPMSGLAGDIFIKVKTTPEVYNLSALKEMVDCSVGDWHKSVQEIQNRYPDKWRKVLLDIGRHDLLFRHDIENFIH